MFVVRSFGQGVYHSSVHLPLLRQPVFVAPRLNVELRTVFRKNRQRYRERLRKKINNSCPRLLWFLAEKDGYLFPESTSLNDCNS